MYNALVTHIGQWLQSFPYYCDLYLSSLIIHSLNDLRYPFYLEYNFIQHWYCQPSFLFVYIYVAYNKWIDLVYLGLSLYFNPCWVIDVSLVKNYIWLLFYNPIWIFLFFKYVNLSTIILFREMFNFTSVVVFVFNIFLNF